ncbi:unnamed protein product [Arctogadus glacialis]
MGLIKPLEELESMAEEGVVRRKTMSRPANKRHWGVCINCFVYYQTGPQTTNISKPDRLLLCVTRPQKLV